jgi:hypothetical protein
MMFMLLLANPLARKILIYAGVALAIFYALRLYSNRIWDQGFREGKTAGTVELEKAKRAEWAGKQEAITAAGASLTQEKTSLSAQAAELARARRQIQASLDDSLGLISFSAKENNAKAASIPGNQLDAALRALSTELAGAPR